MCYLLLLITELVLSSLNCARISHLISVLFVFLEWHKMFSWWWKASLVL